MTTGNLRPPRLRPGALNLAEFLAQPAPPHCGALAVFAGTVRNQHDERTVTGIRYHAYAPLAEKRLAEIEEEGARRYGVRLAVAHAVGELKVGEISVVVVARAGHRGEAFAACRWAIDAIKRSVPIWKEERYADGAAEFLEGNPLRPVSEP
ncbi:MAG: molybdenum cofactor biosynthesis protein MoaE [Sinobacteraceae bacterium]|nr:molybdenum cofactor biosynthesis protein MoaE [Nevskiaceae bacterium]